MKQTFVEQIQAGDRIDDVFLVDSCQRRTTKNGKDYLRLALTDRTGTIEGVMWDDAMEKSPASATLADGDYARVEAQAQVSRYSNKLELVVSSVEREDAGALDPAAFLPTTSRDIGELREELLVICRQVDNAHLRRLLLNLFEDDDFLDAYSRAPAAKNYHHAYIGGLLEHSVAVANLAGVFCSLYPTLDRSLLVTGALLHDVGKVREFDYAGRIDYSTEGRLKGHIVIGNEIVMEAMAAIDGFPDDLKLHLSHLVLSHQGEPEFGAAVKPKTQEAVVLNILDNADAKVNGFLEIAKKYKDGTEWTDFQSMFKDYLYLGKRPDDEPPVQQLSLVDE